MKEVGSKADFNTVRLLTEKFSLQNDGFEFAVGPSPAVAPPASGPSVKKVGNPAPLRQTTIEGNVLTASQEQSALAALPNTGGPNALLLPGAVALIVLGAATVFVARRRAGASD